MDSNVDCIWRALHLHPYEVIVTEHKYNIYSYEVKY